ncbi:MAG: hypothetical protein WC029_15670, partial [Sulfuricella sp.]
MTEPLRQYDPRIVAGVRDVILKHVSPQRLRLDRDREASHDLNRLLDKPGPVVSKNSLEISICISPRP